MKEQIILNHEAWHICPECGNEWDLKDQLSCPSYNCKYVYSAQSKSKQIVYGWILVGTIILYFWMALMVIQILRLLPEIIETIQIINH